MRYSTRLRFNQKQSLIQNNQEIGLSQFMSKVYTKMGAGIAVTMGTSLGLHTVLPTMMENPFVPLGIGAVAAFGSIFGINGLKPIHKTVKQGQELIHYTENPPLREASFWTLSLGMGVSMSPFMGMMMEIDPIIIPAALGISTFIFGGCALYSRNTTNAQIMEWKAPLFFGLTGLIGIQLLGLGSTFIFGPNALSALVHNVDIYGGIGLFTLMSIYDSYMAKQMYLKGEADHLGCATTVYLDFINLLIRIMEALAKKKD